MKKLTAPDALHLPALEDTDCHGDVVAGDVVAFATGDPLYDRLLEQGWTKSRATADIEVPEDPTPDSTEKD